MLSHVLRRTDGRENVEDRDCLLVVYPQSQFFVHNRIPKYIRVSIGKEVVMRSVGS